MSCIMSWFAHVMIYKKTPKRDICLHTFIERVIHSMHKSAGRIQMKWGFIYSLWNIAL